MPSKDPNDDAAPEDATRQSQPVTALVKSQARASSESHQDDTLALQALDEASFVPPPAPSSTLLPAPFAKFVTAATGITTLTVRTYSSAFHWGIGLGRETTLRTLELSRAGLETVIRTAAKDVGARRQGSELGRAEAESLLARSITALHWAFSTASFFTAGGFESADLILGSAEGVTLQSLGTLNAILGSTESSRAVSAIITLIKEELVRPDSEDGTVPGYWDLIVGLAGFVMLQRWGRRKTALEFRGNGGEETIWDIVIDDKGFRADVVGTRRDGGKEVTATKSVTTARADVLRDDHEDLVLERGLDLNGSAAISLSAQDQTSLSDEEIRDRIMAQLPPGTRATITSETLTMKTIKVDIHGSQMAQIEPPPGLTMISEHLGTNSDENEIPHQTIVFRTSLKRSSSAEIEPVERLQMTRIDQEAMENAEAEDVGLIMRSPSRKSMSQSTDDINFDRATKEQPVPVGSTNYASPVANQKKTRKPVLMLSVAPEQKLGKPVVHQDPEKDQKSNVLKKALKSLTPTQSSSSVQKKQRSHSPLPPRREGTTFVNVSPLTRMSQEPSVAPKRVYPVPEGVNTSPVMSPARSPSALRELPTSYFTMHEKKRESTISQTDSFSLHSTDSRPGSPTSYRTHARADSGLSKAKSQTEISMLSSFPADADDGGSIRHHHRSRSFVPSLYSMGTKHSDEAIILQAKTHVNYSIFEDHKMLDALATDGKVPGIFPDRHLVKSIHRFARFASASYGSNFLRVLGIVPSEGQVTQSTDLIAKDVHHEHSSFATHTGMPADTILLSGFCDPKGGTVNAPSGGQMTMTPLMHFISIDRESKAVVLTCRGTLGFEDVLADMTCDYDDIYWQGRPYHVHKGIHEAARRLFDGAASKVMATIRASLEEYPDYGLVLCGHSLGGAVAAVLALLISEPSKRQPSPQSEPESEGQSGTSFITAAQPRLLTNSDTLTTSVAPVTLPAGRPIHVFAYGPPASFSPSLRLATRGLITTIINHNDIVPSLSLGTLHDFKAMALHLKQDPSSPLVKLRQSMMEKVKSAMLGNFWNRESNSPTPVANTGMSATEGNEDWNWKALTSLRNLMINDKLLPPGEVFIIETSRVFDRLDTGEGTDEPNQPDNSYAYKPLGRAATRVQFKLIRNVESRFREVRFGSGMFGDHSPGRYEGGLGTLEKGICEEI